jgi:hypothetical protein
MSGRMSPMDFLRQEGAAAVHDKIKRDVESIRGDDWCLDEEGNEWVRLEAVRTVVDQADPIVEEAVA